jgi:hypothetical protein
MRIFFIRACWNSEFSDRNKIILKKMHSYRVQVTFMSTCWLTLSAVTVPPHTPAMETRHLMYLSFHTCNIFFYNSDIYPFTTVAFHHQGLSVAESNGHDGANNEGGNHGLGSIITLTLLSRQPLMREHRCGTAVFPYLGLAVEEVEGHN